MPEELKDLITEQGKAVTELHAYVQRMEAEFKKGGVAPETKDAIDKLNARLDQIEAKMKTPPAAPEDKGKEPSEAKKAMLKFMRRGVEQLTPDESKTLQVGDDTAGGYLVVPDVATSIIQHAMEYSPVREVANVVPISSSTLEWPSDTGDFTGGWSAETGTRSESSGQTVGKEVITAHEGYVYVKITRQLLEDNAFNLEAYITNKAGFNFAQLEGTAFISGSGAGQPQGLLSNGDVSYTPGGDTSTLVSGDALVTLMHALKATWAKNASFLMNRTTLGVVRTLKDGAGRYLWQPDYASGNPPTIQGAPYREAPDMPDINTNTYPIIYGDFRAAYVIADRVQMSVIRDVFTSKASGLVEFMFYKRVGGQVVLAEAVRKLKIATS